MTGRKCEICGDPAHGNHFGVLSCRACAAFFRRCANTKYERLGCLSRHCNEKSCSYLCKSCRLKRCRAVGMDSSKFQHNRDSIRKSNISKSLESFIGRPFTIFFCTPTSSEPQKTFINLQNLIDQAQRILMLGSESPWSPNGSCLGKLTNAIGFLQLERRPEIFKKMTQNEVSGIWNFYLLATARWLTHFQPFQDLKEPLKLQILLATWQVWNRLHKLIATALYRTRNPSAKSDERVLGNGILTENLIHGADIRWLSEYSIDQIAYYLDGIHVVEIGGFTMTDYSGNLAFSDTELTFMMGQLCFQYSSRRFPGIAEVMDGFQEILANDLHRYYSEDQKTLRYSERIGKMMKVNNAIQEIIRNQRNRAEIAKVFHIFHVDFSHPEMFRDTGLA